MENPFKYSNIVTDKAFCNRVAEQESLLSHMQQSQNVLVYAHRRKGKSSLIKQVIRNIETRKLDLGVVYVDLFGTTSEADFVKKTFNGIGRLKSSAKKLMDFLAKHFRQLPFKVGVDPVHYTPVLSFDSKVDDMEVQLQTLMDLLAKFSEQRRLVVIYDEFQEIANYSNSDVFEKRLRSFIQQHDRISYVFSGSQRHILVEMFQSQGRAFYLQAASFPLEEIHTGDYIPWLKKLFSASRHSVSQESLGFVVERFENHPMYIQYFCFLLWEELQKQPWQDDMIDEIEATMIKRKQAEYQILWDSLTGNQRKVLKLVRMNNGQNLFSAQALGSVEIKTASVVTQCLNVLCSKEVLVKNGNYRIQDLLLGKWVGRLI